VGDLFELRLESMTMGEYENNFLGFIKYVGFIKEEKVKIQRFLSGLPSFYKDKIQYDEPKTLIETITKDKYMYEQSKGREYFHNPGRIRRRKNMIREGRDPNLFSIETILAHINNIKY
jgi:hypothetical protein